MGLMDLLGLGSSAKNSTETINQSINEAISKNIQKTTAAGSASQVIDVSGNNNNVCRNTMGQGISVIAKGDFTNAMAVQTQNDIMSKLQSSASSSTNAFGILSKGSSENDTKVTNIVKNSFTLENIQECLGSVAISQAIKISGSGNVVCDNAMLQTATAVTDCISKNTGVLTAINKIVSDTTTSSTQTQQSLLGSLVGGMCPDLGLGSSGTCIITIVCICLLGGGAYLYFTSQGSDSGTVDNYGQADYDPGMADTISPPNIDSALLESGSSGAADGSYTSSSANSSSLMKGGASSSSWGLPSNIGGININVILLGCLVIGGACMYSHSLSKAKKCPSSMQIEVIDF